MEPVIVAYKVIDNQARCCVGTYKNKQRARNAVVKKDCEYGGYKHYILAVDAAGNLYTLGGAKAEI